MKNPFAVICLSLLWLISLSCNKKDASSKLPADPVAVLAASSSLQEFGLIMIPSMIEMAGYHHRNLSSDRKQTFLAAVQHNSQAPAGLANTYRAAGLNFEVAIGIKNRVDRAMLKLIRDHPFLEEMDPLVAEKTVYQALDKIIRSEDPGYNAWKAKLMGAVQPALLFSGSDTGLQTALAINGTGLNYMAPKITLSDIWNCLVEAAGFGTAGVLGIGGLQKLAKEGIQEIVISLSKFLAKNAGWFGLALIIFQLADCIYSHITT